MHRSRGKLSNSIAYRCLAVFTTLLLFVPLCELPNRAAEETAPTKTNWLFKEGNPVYVIVVPRAEKLPPRPLDIPIVSSRRPPREVNADDLKLPFAMSAPQAVAIGNGLLADGEAEMALTYFQEAQKLQANSVDVLTGLGQCYYELKRDDDALAVYKEVLAQNTTSWQVQYNLGRIHLENKRYAEAIEAFRNALKLKPADPDIISGLGVALTKHGDNTEAIGHLTQIAALNRYNAQSFYNLGEAYANDGQWLKAAEAFKTGADNGGGIDPNGYSYWATMLFYADKLDEALAGYQTVKRLDLKGTNVNAALYTAEILRLRGKLSEALGQYQLVLNQTDDVEALFQAGYLCFKLNQLELAKTYFKRLTTVDPKHAGAAANLAGLEAQFNENLKRLNQPTPGITLREVVQANPTSAEAHTNLGAQFITEGMYPEAASVLEKAVSLKPDSAAAQYDLGLAQLKTGQYDQSVVSNQRALALKPNWAEAYNNLGLGYANLNKWDEAAKAHGEAVRLVPNYSGALYNLGRDYWKLNQKALAEEMVQKLEPLNWNLKAELINEILGVVVPPPGQQPVAVATPTPAATPIPAPAPTPIAVSTPPAEPLPTPSTEKVDTKNVLPAETPAADCPEPIYRPGGVTRMATFTSELQAAYTDEALQNKVVGKIVLTAVLCGNGRVSDISVKEQLPYGLTERAIEAMRKVQFQPALLDSKPVTVMVTQTFLCAQSTCTAVVTVNR